MEFLQINFKGKGWGGASITYSDYPLVLKAKGLNGGSRWGSSERIYAIDFGGKYSKEAPYTYCGIFFGDVKDIPKREEVLSFLQERKERLEKSLNPPYTEIEKKVCDLYLEATEEMPLDFLDKWKEWRLQWHRQQNNKSKKIEKNLVVPDPSIPLATAKWVAQKGDMFLFPKEGKQGEILEISLHTAIVRWENGQTEKIKRGLIKLKGILIHP